MCSVLPSSELELVKAQSCTMNIVAWSPVPWSLAPVQYSAVQHSTVQFSSVQYCRPDHCRDLLHPAASSSWHSSYIVTRHQPQAGVSCLVSDQLRLHITHPLRKGLDKKINIRLLTPVFIIIYQDEHNLWCPGNVGWENFANWEKFEVKYGKNGQKWQKISEIFFLAIRYDK